MPSGFVDSAILSDFRAALICIRDHFIDPSVPDIVHSIARLLLLASLRGLGMRLSWVPAHLGIRGNETADYSPNPLLVFLSSFALRSRLGTCCWICGVTSWHGAV